MSTPTPPHPAPSESWQSIPTARPLATPAHPLEFVDEYGPIQEPGVSVPTASDILQHCDYNTPRGHYTYTLGQSTFHIKYGFALRWNEVMAQVLASRGLAQIRSEVRVPTVYYAFELAGRGTVFIVMDHIDGQTIGDLGYEEGGPAKGVTAEVGRALVDLAHVPLSGDNVPLSLDLRPSSVWGGRIYHEMFGEYGAPRHYCDASQLEAHINLFLSTIRFGGEKRITDLLDEPLVLCQGDIWPHNFMKDKQGRLWIIDLADVDILPSSFVAYSLRANKFYTQLCNDDSYFAEFPLTDNVKALFWFAERMDWQYDGFRELGLEVPGADKETSEMLKKRLPRFNI
ncbi:hypothetical protein ABW21_db0205145 [Orbilia brochopaga]|nr:hypothetical protein ABW21_db0205145 [Drechslerella brochopaga]